MKRHAARAALLATLLTMLCATAAHAEGTRVFGKWIVHHASDSYHPENPHFPETMRFKVKRNSASGSEIVIAFADGIEQHDIGMTLHGIEEYLPAGGCERSTAGEPGTVIVYHGTNSMHAHDENGHGTDHELWARFFFDPFENRQELCFQTSPGTAGTAASKHFGTGHSHSGG